MGSKLGSMHLVAALYTLGSKLGLASGCAVSDWVGGIERPSTGSGRTGAVPTRTAGEWVLTGPLP